MTDVRGSAPHSLLAVLLVPMVLRVLPGAEAAAGCRGVPLDTAGSHFLTHEVP